MKPLFKVGSCQDLENYRPISMLHEFSKMFELAINKRLTNFFFIILYLKTTSMVIWGIGLRIRLYNMHEFTKTALKFLDNYEIAIEIFLNLSNAYDHLNKDNLLIKFERHGEMAYGSQSPSFTMEDKD